MGAQRPGTPYLHPAADLDDEYGWKDFHECLDDITEHLDALASSSRERKINQTVDKCEEALGSDATMERDILDEIERQLSSVSLSREKIEKAKKHATLSWTGCYNDSCWTHLEDKEGSRWFPRRPPTFKRQQKEAQRKQALEAEVAAQEQGKVQIPW